MVCRAFTYTEHHQIDVLPKISHSHIMISCFPCAESSHLPWMDVLFLIYPSPHTQAVLKYSLARKGLTSEKQMDCL